MAIHSGKKDEVPSPAPPLDPVATEDEFSSFDSALRPQTLAEYVGQSEVKQNLAISIEAAQKREEPIDHVLVHGPPGLGKTTLANVIANEMKTSIRITSGPALERQGDVAAIITNLEPGDILFIDEIHRLRPAVEEVLYSAMEDFAIDIVLGKGPSARSMRLSLPRFTLIGATTKLSLMSSPMRDRFGHLFRLDFYTPEEMTEIIHRSAGRLELALENTAAARLAKSARQTPRIANRLLRRVRDYACVQEVSRVDEALVVKALDGLGIDPLGLDEKDRRLLQLIIERFGGGPVGLNTMAAAIREDAQTIEDIYEPYLLHCGFLERTPRGRSVTARAYRHLGIL